MATQFYAHVGFPKCGSTALQNGYFSVHPQLFHLGASGGGSTAPYRNTGLRTVIEVELRLARDFVYDRAYVDSVMDRERAEFAASNRTVLGLSSESLVMHMHSEADVPRKAERLRDALGSDTRILIVTRRQDTLLRSLYREFIKSGMTLTFDKFARAIRVNRLTSLYSELFYDRCIETYKSLFGEDNVLVLPHELLVESPDIFLHAVSTHLGVRHEISELAVRNPGPGDAVLEARRRLNAQYPFGLGLSVLEGVNLGRYPEYLSDRLDMDLPEEVRREEERRQSTKRIAREWVKDKHGRLRSLLRRSRLGPAPTGIDFTVDQSTWGVLMNDYSRTNERLQALCDFDLRRYGYMELQTEKSD